MLRVEYDIHSIMVEQVVAGSWFFKTNDDGVFVKVNDQRVKNCLGNLMEEVIEVKEANARNNQNIVVGYCLLVIGTDYLAEAQFNCKGILNSFLLVSERQKTQSIRPFYQMISCAKV